MPSVSVWERVERRKLRQRDRWRRPARPGDRPDASRPAGTDLPRQPYPVAGGKLNGFVTATEQAVPEGDKTAAMSYWTERDLPFYHGLARTFPLADRWFSSCLGPTFPNRRFLLAGMASGLMDDLPVNLLDRPRAGTIMDMLTRHEVSWVNYRPASSDQSEFRRYLQYRRRRTRHHLAPFGRPLRTTSDGFKRDLQFTAAIYPLGMAGYMAHVRSLVALDLTAPPAFLTPPELPAPAGQGAAPSRGRQ